MKVHVFFEKCYLLLEKDFRVKNNMETYFPLIWRNWRNNKKKNNDLYKFIKEKSWQLNCFLLFCF